MSRRDRIIALNDKLRTTFRGGKVQTMPSVYDLDARLRGRALRVVSKYNRFDAESDHDWGTFIFGGYIFEWFIEYFDADGSSPSPDPADPQKTLRVLTLCVVDDILTSSGDNRQEVRRGVLPSRL